MSFTVLFSVDDTLPKAFFLLVFFKNNFAHTDFISVYYLIHKNIKMNYFNSTEVKSQTSTSDAQFSFTFFGAHKVVILQRNHRPINLIVIKMKC